MNNCPTCAGPISIGGEGSTHWHECATCGPVDPAIACHATPNTRGISSMDERWRDGETDKPTPGERCVIRYLDKEQLEIL